MWRVYLAMAGPGEPVFGYLARVFGPMVGPGERVFGCAERVLGNGRPGEPSFGFAYSSVYLRTYGEACEERVVRGAARASRAAPPRAMPLWIYTSVLTGVKKNGFLKNHGLLISK